MSATFSSSSLGQRVLTKLSSGVIIQAFWAFAAADARIDDITQVYIGGPKGLPVFLQFFNEELSPTRQFVLMEDGFYWRDASPILAVNPERNGLKLLNPNRIVKHGLPDRWQIIEGEVVVVFGPSPSIRINGDQFDY